MINKDTILESGLYLISLPIGNSKDIPLRALDYLSNVDEIYCCSVNDTFVMNAWAEVLGIKNVKVIPDGSGNFTRYMGMLIGKNHRGFGNRSWRYMCVINDGVIEKWWQEPGINNDGQDDDPYEQTTPENMIAYLESVK